MLDLIAQLTAQVRSSSIGVPTAQLIQLTDALSQGGASFSQPLQLMMASATAAPAPAIAQQEAVSTSSAPVVETVLASAPATTGDEVEVSDLNELD